MLSTAINRHRDELESHGYTILPSDSADATEHLLTHFGVLVPQYDGQLRYHVAAEPGNNKRRWSRSTNAIPLHTEVPCWENVPRLLALHCVHQATCGSGHTDLVDLDKIVATFDTAEHIVACEHLVLWVDRNAARGALPGIRRPMVERRPDGRKLIRFRHNLLLRGRYEPALTSDEHEEPFGSARVALRERVDSYLKNGRIPLLIPEHSVLLFDNWRMAHGRSAYADTQRHLIRYWLR